MGMLMIKCPSTGRDVPTGIETLDSDRLPDVTATLACPACGRIHAWSRRQTWVADGGRQYRLHAAH